jgi:hypothetical protein
LTCCSRSERQVKEISHRGTLDVPRLRANGRD